MTEIRQKPKIKLNIINSKTPNQNTNNQNTNVQNKLNYQIPNQPKNTTVQTQSNQKIIANVFGKVSYVNAKNRNLFAIHAEKLNKKFRCELIYKNPFLPIKIGDAICGIAEYDKYNKYGETLKLIQAPFVVLGEDKNSIIDLISKGLRGTGYGLMKAHKLYELMLEKFGSNENITKSIDNLSNLFCYKKINDMVLLISYSILIKPHIMLRLLNYWYKNRNLRRLYLLGLNNKEIKNTKFGPTEVYKECLQNPYSLYSIPLEKCDNIFNRLGKTVDSKIKKCAIIVRKLYECTEQRGWTGVPSRVLMAIYPDISIYMDTLRSDFNVKTDMFTAYLPYNYEVETEISNMIKDLTDAPQMPNALHKSEISYTRNDLTDAQKNVIYKALNDNISIIKGGGGVGKSTIIKEIIHNLKEKKIKYKVASFTGKAVARIREITEEKNPITMHMAIAMGDKNKNDDFAHLIIDEASMVTTELLYEFMMKFGTNYRITLIGDPNQLTPISWGTLFAQVIKSQTVPTYTLSMSHRVAKENQDQNGILLNANNIVECADEMYNGPPFEFEITSNFKIIEGELSIIKKLLEILKNSGVENKKITIISPFNKNLFEINKICQDIYNGSNRSSRDMNGKIWRIGDRVMMTENNYKVKIMNGDEGIVTDLTEHELQVTFKDGTAHVFKFCKIQDKNKTDPYELKTKELTTNHIVHSFAVSVHRYQGSECDYIIFYIPKSNPSKFLNRNLLYTGITRAKKIIWMVGDNETMLRAATTKPAFRCDNLCQRLMQNEYKPKN